MSKATATPTPSPKIKKCLILRTYFGLVAVNKFAIVPKPNGVSIIIDEALINESKYCHCNKFIEPPKLVVNRVQPRDHEDYEVSYLSCSNKCALDVQSNNGYSKAMLNCALVAFNDPSLMRD